jgi:hypothetical protein
MTYSYFNSTKEAFKNDSTFYANQYNKALKKEENKSSNKSNIETDTNKKLITYKKRNFVLNNDYFDNNKYITLNLANGYKSSDNGYHFDKSDIENDYLLKLELPIINNYHYLTYKLKLNGKYSKESILGIGVTNNKTTWLYKIDTVKSSITIIQTSANENKIHKIYNLNKKLAKLELFVTIDKINNRIHLQLQNGTNLLEKWISDKIIINKNELLYFTLHRFNKENAFLFEKLTTTIDYYYEGNIDENVIELEDTTCDADEKVDYMIYINRYVIVTIVFIIFMIITYLTRYKIK